MVTGLEVWLQQYARSIRLGSQPDNNHNMASPESSSVDPNSVSGSSEQGETVTNALSQLGRTQASNFARGRVVASNKGKNKTKRGPGKTIQKKSTSRKYVSVDARIREFKEEPFRKSNGKLFCEVCREEVSVEARIIKRLVESSRHKSGKERLSQKKKREMLIVDAMKNYDQEVHPTGEMLSDNQRVSRVEVPKTFLKAGVPLQKMDDFVN